MKKHEPLNPRQQAFADLVLAGTPAGRAWEKAGYQARGNAAEAAASKAMKTPRLREYLRTERARMADAGQIERAELVAYLADVIRTPIRHVDSNSPLVQELTTEETGTGATRTRIRMVDKLQACKLLAAIMGWTAPAKIIHSADNDLSALLLKIRSQNSNR